MARPRTKEEKLAAAAVRGGTAAIRSLLKGGTDPNAPGILLTAVSARKPASVKLLIQAGADVNIQDSIKLSPLHKAALLGDTRIMNILLEAGAKTELHDINGRTPLHCACLSNERAVKMLLSYGADADSVNTEGETPLIYADIGYDWKSVQHLLNAAASHENAD